jgi:hypothetical protein
VQISVESGEADKEGKTDQVLDSFDVLVEINQRMHRSDLPDGTEYV